MQKISKQLTTFTDHRRKGESLWLKKFLKNIGDIISKQEFGGSLRLKIRSLCLKIKKNTGTSAGKESFSNILGQSEMHLHVPVETKQVQKVDLNWTCLFCSYGNGMVRSTGSISGSLFLTIRILNLF